MVEEFSTQARDHSEIFAQEIKTCLEDKKGEDVLIVDVRKQSNFCDFFIIATGHVTRQLIAMADHLERALKNSHFPFVTEGAKQNSDWIVIDTGPVIVHLFRGEVRDYYNLEKMWSA